jgi:hypothetical protein
MSRRGLRSASALGRDVDLLTARTYLFVGDSTTVRSWVVAGASWRFGSFRIRTVVWGRGLN